MKINLGSKPLLAPMPVLIVGTYSADGTPNAMNAAWGGISEECEISICIDDSHKTAENLKSSGAFTVGVADVDTMIGADYVGITSANDVENKMQACGWHAEKSKHVNAPVFDEIKLTLECQVKSYDESTCRLVGEIVNVLADEAIIGKSGKVDLSLMRPITYDPFIKAYRVIGDVCGKAFSAGLEIKKNAR